VPGDFASGGWLLDDGVCTVACSEPDAEGLRTCGRGEAFESNPDSIDCSKCVQPDAMCVLWGDPHILPFDREVRSRNGRGSNVNLYDYGDFWIVKSEPIYIQARYWSTRKDGNSMTRSLAVGGAFLGGNTLFIEPLDGTVLWNDKEILSNFPSRHEEDGLMYARYHNEAEVVRTGGTHDKIKGLDIMLPLGVRITVNRYRSHLDVLVNMHQVPGGLDGHCGNFNGDDSDDTTKLIGERMGAPVARVDNLFVVKDYTLVGCFAEKGGDPDLPEFRGNNLNDEECSLACVDSMWFGIQGNEKCYCGDSYGKHGAAEGCNCEGGGTVPAGKQCVYGYFDSEQPPAHSLDDCDADLLEKANELCNAAFDSEEVENVEMRNLCKFDVCFGSEDFADEDAWAAHVQLPCASVADVQKICAKQVGACSDGDAKCDVSACGAYTELGWWDGEIRLLQDGQARSDGTLASVVQLEHRAGICVTDSNTLEECNAGQCSRKGGLVAQFFYITGVNSLRDFPDFDSLTPDTTRIDKTVSYAVTTDAWPWSLAVADFFGARWLGGIIITTEGDYTFATNSDDGSHVYIDGELVVNNGGLHGMRTRTGTVTLAPGLHSLRMIFWEQKGGAGMLFYYTGPDSGGNKVVVPADVLVPSEALGLR